MRASPDIIFNWCSSWANPDPVRRHYYDSGANEGIGFYAEEMMMHAGLFDDSPRTREIIWNFMRLRALRVEVDVKLALGEFTIDQGAEYLKNTSPWMQARRMRRPRFLHLPRGRRFPMRSGNCRSITSWPKPGGRKGRFSLRDFHDFLGSTAMCQSPCSVGSISGLRDEVDAIAM